MKTETSKDKALKFIGKFLMWYQDSYGMPDVVNRIKLEELNKQAEQIHMDRIRELDEYYHKSVVSDLNDKPTKILKKQVKKLVRNSKQP